MEKNWSETSLDDGQNVIPSDGDIRVVENYFQNDTSVVGRGAIDIGSSEVTTVLKDELENNQRQVINPGTTITPPTYSNLQHYLFLSLPLCSIQLNNLPDNFGGISPVTQSFTASSEFEQNRLTFNDANKEVAIYNSKKFMLFPLMKGDIVTKRLPTLVDLKGLMPTAAKSSSKRTFFAMLYEQRRLVIFAVVSSDSTKPHSAEYYTHFDLIEKKTRPNLILDFHWISDSYLLVVSTYSIDFISVKEKHKPVKTLKSIYENIRFCKFSPTDNLLVLALEGKNTALYPYIITPSGQMNKLTKVELTNLNIGDHKPIKSSETFLVSMYGRCCLVCICSANHEMHIFKYKPQNVQAFVQQRIFNLFSGSNIALNVVDSLLIVHNLDDKTSTAYDVFTKQDYPVSPPLSISPHYSVKDPLTQADTPVDATDRLYKTDSWTYWYPNYILDKELGYVFELRLSISHMPINMRNRKDSIKFLFRRVNSKALLLTTLRTFIESKSEDLKTISEILELVNKYYWNQLVKLETEKQEKFSEKLKRLSVFTKPKALEFVDINMLSEIEEGDEMQETQINTIGYPIIMQSDMYKFVFVPIDEAGSLSTIELVSVLVEYVRGLKKSNIPVHNFIQKLLIELLVKDNNFSMLHQLIQFKVIGDSQLTALQMLHISEKYPPAYQISLDILKRLNDYDLLCEVLLSKKDVSRVLELMMENWDKHSFKISYAQVFEAAVSQNNPTLFYTTYEILQRINLKQRKTILFSPEDKCKEYDELYAKLFVNVK